MSLYSIYNKNSYFNEKCFSEHHRKVKIIINLDKYLFFGSETFVLLTFSEQHSLSIFLYYIKMCCSVQLFSNSWLSTIDMREYIDCSLAQPTCLVMLSGYLARHHLSVGPQSVAKYKFYCTVYYITLNSNYSA